jgi:fatty acid desaturase
VKAASLRRKFVRDALGITGLKFYLGRLLMDMGYLKWTIAADQTPLPPIPLSQRLILLVQNFWRTALINAVLFALLWLAGHGWLLAWFWLAYTTPFPLFLRIRSMAEHACTEASNDMFKNTRTTEAGWLARMTVAPIRVNYHIEHHVMASVPYYRLPWMHQLLRAKNAVPVPPTYGQVLGLMVKA